MTKRENWNDLGDDEKGRLLARTPIAPDDREAVSTPAGWERWLREAAEKRARVPRGGADVPHGRFWFAGKPESPAPDILVECERFVDARRAARAVLRLPEVSVSPRPPHRPVAELPLVQVRWEGSAAGRAPDLRLRARRTNPGKKPGDWKDL